MITSANIRACASENIEGLNLDTVDQHRFRGDASWTVNSKGTRVAVVLGLVIPMTCVRADDAAWKDHDGRGWNSQQRRDYRAAEAHFGAAMDAATAFGLTDSRLGHRATDLAWTLYFQGRYSEAEPFAMHGLKIRVAATHEGPDLAEALDAVAVIQHARGRYAESEAARKRSIAILEQTRGIDDPDVAASLNPFVATSLTDQGNFAYVRGRYAECQPLFTRALQIEEKALGHDHPRVACTLACLAYAYQCQGDLPKAEAHYRRALAIREKMLPAVPPDVAGILENYTALLRTTGRMAEASALEARDRSHDE